MIGYLLMAVGAAMVIMSIIGILKYFFQPLIETYQVVIKREDDYAHYTSPRGIAYLNEHKKKYLTMLAVLFIAGAGLFSLGLYMNFGPRGFEMLLSPNAQQGKVYDAVDTELAEGFDANGNYVAPNGKIYSRYVLIKGNEIYYGQDLVGDIDAFRDFAPAIDRNSRLYLIDGYASAAAFREAVSILDSNGIGCDWDE